MIVFLVNGRLAAGALRETRDEQASVSVSLVLVVVVVVRVVWCESESPARRLAGRGHKELLTPRYAL